MFSSGSRRGRRYCKAAPGGVFEVIKALHKVCHDEGVHTIALGIPDIGGSAAARLKKARLNDCKAAAFNRENKRETAEGQSRISSNLEWAIHELK